MYNRGMRDKERQIMLGSLLGDGALYRKSARSFIFSVGNTKPEYVNDLARSLSSFSHKRIKFVKNKPPRKPLYRLNITIGIKTEPEHLEETCSWYDGFYGNATEKHHIPSWLVPTPLMMYHMYIGDGTLSDRMQLQKKTMSSFRMLRIGLATDCFVYEDIKRFFDKLPVSYIIIRSNRNVNLNGQRARDFLKYIGRCRTPEYAYKWKLMDKEFGKQYGRRKTRPLMHALTLIAAGRIPRKEMITVAKTAIKHSVAKIGTQQTGR